MDDIGALIEQSTAVACIGMGDGKDLNNLTEIDQMDLMAIGYALAKLGKRINSGNCQGSDHLYALGGNAVNPASVHLYLTGPDHNPKFIVEGNHLYYEADYPDWAPIAKKYHFLYRAGRLGSWVQKLMNRNAGIILASDLVIANPNPKKSWGGGTGHGMKIAKEESSIPVIDISKDEVRVALINYFILKKIIPHYERILPSH